MAIKVNGTTVIDDSRNLVNIASGAGGGFWKFISETNVTSSVSQVEISLPTGYDVYRLIIKDPFFNRATGTYVNGQCYLSTNNGSSYSTQYYRQDGSSRSSITWYENFKPDATNQSTSKLHAYFDFHLKMNDSNGPFIMTAFNSWKVPWNNALSIDQIETNNEEFSHYWLESFTNRVNKIKFDGNSTNTINQGDFILYGANDIG